MSPRQTWPAFGWALLCTHAWVVIVNVGILRMFTEWIKGLMGYEAKSFVWLQRSVKCKNIPILGILPTAHHVTGLGGLLTGTVEWALAVSPAVKCSAIETHTHTNLHHTNLHLFSCPLLIQQCQRPGSGMWTPVLLQGNIFTSFSYHYSVHRGSQARAREVDKGI